MNPPSPSTTEGVSVSVRDLRKSFGSVDAVKGVSFEVSPAEIFVIMGPSGSGKSVLLKHIIGLEEADAGEILIGDESIHAPGVKERHRMAMVFQSGGLLNSLNVGENVGLYLSEHRLHPPEEITKIVAEKLALVDMSGQEPRLLSELSGGMKKRVAIARALVVEPQLILYDEPTSELDPLTARAVAEEIVKSRARNRVTSLVVTHDRDLAFGIADRIAIMFEGELLVIGSPEEVRQSKDANVQRFLTVEFNLNTERK